jgi:hypothetical protein
MEVQPEPSNVSGQLSFGVIADVFITGCEVTITPFLRFNDLDPADHSPGTCRAQGPRDPRHEPGRSHRMPHPSTGAAPVQLSLAAALGFDEVDEVGRLLLVPRIGEAREIPGRIDEGVHRVGVAPRVPAAVRAGDVLACRVMVERVARLLERDIRRQRHRKLAVDTGTAPQSSQWITGIGEPQ